MARIQAYKFVNPGVSNVASPKVHAAAKHTLAVNRIGSTVEGIGHVVTDLVAINKATLAFQKRVERTQKLNLRRERDAAAEERQERASLKLKSQQERRAKEDKKKFKLEKPKDNPFMDWAEKTFAPLRDFFLAIIGISIIKKYNDIRNNPEEQERWEDFWFKTSFVFGKIWNFATGSFKSVMEGWQKLFGKEKTFGERLDGLGKIVTGIAGFAAIGFFLNPMALVNLVLGGIDWMLNWSPDQGGASDLLPDGSKKPGKKPGGKPSTTTVRPPTKKLSPFELQQARKAVTTKNMLAKPTSGLSPKLAPKGAIFGRGVDKATQRIMLRILGKGGVKWLTKTFNKIPLIGPLITFAFNWAAGEPFLKAAVQGVGMGLGQWLGGMAGSAIGGLGGPAAPITVPLGAFIGAMLGGIGGEFLGGYLYDLVAGKADLGKDLGALGGKIKSALESLWNDYIMNGDFWAGAWQTFLNVGGDIMKNTWSAIQSLWSYASGAVANFAEMLMKASQPWRDAVFAAFQKYVLNGPGEVVNLIMETLLAGAEGIGKLFEEGGPIIARIIKTSAEAAIKWAFNKVKGMLTGWNIGNFLGKLADLIKLVGAPVSYLPEMLNAIGGAVSKDVSDALGKAGEVIDIVVDPIKQYINPAIVAIQKTWDMVSNLGGWVYNNGIKPIFDLVTGIWTSGPKIWDWLNRPNTFQEVTGQQVPERAGGGKVALYAGHADMLRSDRSKAFGTSGGGISGTRSTAPHQSYAKGYLSNEAYFNDKIAQKAAQKSGGLAMYRKPVRTRSGSDPNSNWSRIDKDNAKGITTVEIHMDAPKPMGMRGMMGINPDMRTRGNNNGFLKALNGAYGVHNTQKGLGSVNRNNLSALLEVAPLGWNVLKNANSFIETESSKIANAIKLGAKGKVPEMTGDPNEDFSGDYTGDDYSGGGDGNIDADPPEPPPPPDPMSALENLQKGLLDAFGMGDKLAAAEDKEEKLQSADAFKMAAEGKLDGLSSIVDLSKFKFSQEYAMQNEAANMIPFAVAIQMPVPITIKNTINTGGDQVVNVRKSPFTDK